MHNTVHFNVDRWVLSIARPFQIQFVSHTENKKLYYPQECLPHRLNPNNLVSKLLFPISKYFYCQQVQLHAAFFTQNSALGVYASYLRKLHFRPLLLSKLVISGPFTRGRASLSPQTDGHYLQAASGTVLRYDADVGRVDAGSDEPGQVVELDVSHLKITTQTRRICERNSLQPSRSRTPWKQRSGWEWRDWWFIYTQGFEDNVASGSSK